MWKYEIWYMKIWKYEIWKYEIWKYENMKFWNMKIEIVNLGQVVDEQVAALGAADRAAWKHPDWLFR